MSRKQYVDTGISLENIDQTLKDFLASKKKSTTRKTYGCLVRKLLEFTHGETGAQMLTEHKAWSEKKLIDFLEWLKKQGYSDAYATTACGMVQAFFNKNRMPLDLIKDDRKQLTERKRVSQDYLFSKADIAKMTTIGSLKEKYVVLAGASYGLRSEDFAEITYGKMRLAVEKAENEKLEAPIPVDPIETMKERGVKAYPFINSDALPIIKAILDSNRDKPDSERIWNERPTQLTTVLQVLAKKSGINPHESRIRFHNLRKYLSDRLSSVMSESKWKQIVGKKISEGAYISALDLREDYLRAMPSIVVNTNGNGETRHKLESLEQVNIDQKKDIIKLQEDVLRLLEQNKKLNEKLDQQHEDYQHLRSEAFEGGKRAANAR